MTDARVSRGVGLPLVAGEPAARVSRGEALVLTRPDREARVSRVVATVLCTRIGPYLRAVAYPGPIRWKRSGIWHDVATIIEGGGT